LARKAQFFLDGHKLEDPEVCTYASVVSRESVRLAFMLAVLNGLDVLAADAEGAYLNVPSREKLYMKCGIEFGECKGRIANVRRALHGTKSAAACWRATISKVIEGLGFQICKADNDTWMRKGFNVWECMPVYSDDLLAIAQDKGEIMVKIDQQLKDGSLKSPDSYLGAAIRKHLLTDGTEAWYLSSNTCVKNAIKNVEDWPCTLCCKRE
jgi:hypothetical protein